MMEDVTSPRPSRHPKSGMSSSARHSASSIAFISRMGVSTRGISLGSPHSSVRRHTSVWAKSPRFDGVQLTVVRTQRAFLRGGGRHLSQTFSTPQVRYCMSSSARSTSVGHQARLFQLLLPHTKKRQWPKTHSGPALPEPLPLQREVQDVDVEDYHVPDSGRGLVRHYRPEGCLFSHPGRQAAQDVSLVCLWRKGLPIQSPSLWPGLGAEDIHEVHGCCTGPI